MDKTLVVKKTECYNPEVPHKNKNNKEKERTMYKFKDAAKRGSALLGAVGLLVGLGASAIPAFVSADPLNPLTQRSLSLSSSSPGWSYTDGSGNATYAPPNSGANGKQTGNYYSFFTSSTANLNGLSFQYCTVAAGKCFSPGTDGYTQSGGALTACQTAHNCTRAADTGSTTDLNIVSGTSGNAPAEVSSGDWSTICASNSQVPNPNQTQGNFVVYTGSGNCGTYSSGWTMSTVNLEDDIVGNATGATGKQNTIVLQNASPQSIAAGTQIQVRFFGTNFNYITNPGAGAFFVKINDYDDTDVGGYPYSTTASGTYPNRNAGDFGPSSSYIVDGGVTVANVMNLSIEIQTKVLETMDFSVGTVDPDTLTNAQLSTATSGTLTAPGACDPILTAFTPTDPQNTLYLGNENAEDSLMTSEGFATHSYFRLSSNSSGGATVYYSGVTLSNTENNQIDAAGITAASSIVGTEQFGLGLDTGSGPNYAPDYSVANNDGITSVKYENGADTDNGVNTPGHGAPSATGGTFGVSSDWTTYESGSGGAAHNPQLGPLVPEANYGSTSGGINGASAGDGNTTAQYSFNPNANTVPTPLATESSAVVNCVTGKVRYLANIAATTAAGIYTTKINYIASPQY